MCRISHPLLSFKSTLTEKQRARSPPSPFLFRHGDQQRPLTNTKGRSTMARKQNTNLKLVAQGSGKPREQTLQQILELVDGWIYGAVFNRGDLPSPGDICDLVDETFEQIGVDSYFHDWPSDYKDPADITRGASGALDANRPGKLLLAITESLPTEALNLKGDVADLHSRAYWRAFFMARGGFAIGVFLGLRMAGAPDALIERVGRQFVDRN